MLRGSQHEETGWLNDDRGQLILRRDGGGRWRLDMGWLLTWRTRNLLGKRVRVIGIRSDFDLLAVSSIKAA